MIFEHLIRLIYEVKDKFMNTKNSLFTTSLVFKLRFRIIRELYIIHMIMIFNVIDLHLIGMVRACLHSTLLAFNLKK